MLIRCTLGVSMCTGDYGQIKPGISRNLSLVLTALYIV